MTAIRTNWSNVKVGLRSLLSRNAMVAILYNIAYQYSTNMKNSFRPLVVSESCDLPMFYITMLASLFSFVAFLINVPVGVIVDRRRGMLKRVMVSVNILRALVYIFGYGMITTRTGAYIVYILDGIVFCFCGIMGPALLAISVDKSVMGSAFALYNGAVAICVSTSKSLGAALFNDGSQFIAGGTAGAVALLSAIILLVLDGDKVSETLRKEQSILNAKGIQEEPAPVSVRIKSRKLNRLLASISVAAIPLALCIGLGQIEESICNSYLAIMGEERGFDYYAALSVFYSISGIITVFIGTLCDIVNPVIMVYLGLAGKIIGNFLIAETMVQDVFLVGLCAITLSDFFITVVQISAAKMFPYRQQGRVTATINLMMHICMMALTLPAGFMAERSGAGGAYMYSAITSSLAAVAYTYSILYFRRHRKSHSEG